MKRLLITLIPWMVLVMTAHGQTRSADIDYTYQGHVAQHGVRVGDDCYVPTSFPTAVGWEAEEHDGSMDLTVEGRQARVALRMFGNKEMIPLSQALDALGFVGDWKQGTNTFQILAPLKSVGVENGQLNIESVLSVKPQVTVLANPNRLVIDLLGAKLKPETKLKLDSNTRISQYKPDTVRVVVETATKPDLPASADAGKLLAFTYGPATVTSKPSDLNQVVEPVKDPVTPQVPTTDQGTSLLPTINAGPLRMVVEGPTAALLELKLSGALKDPARFRRPDADVLEILLTGVKIDLGEDFKLDSPSIESVGTRMEGNVSVLTLKLSRPMGVEVSMAPSGMQIQLLKPNVGNGRLAGKVVVVDAGHGGHDSGAKSMDGSVLEKNLTLAIAKLLSQKLAQEGATVIMTRKTDEFIKLQERPMIANRNNADFFLSVHINSNGLDTKSSGSITFYHKGNAISSVLADCIQREIALTSGLPSIGVWSDGKIYESGFAVLRGSKMPAVLVECGFINNGKDRKRMVTADFQKAIADSIVRGLRIYLGDDKAKKEESK